MALARAGLTDNEICKAMGISLAPLREERRIDPSFADDLKAARALKFEPVYAKAIELALQADELGINEGSIKAMELVLRFASKALDRETRVDILDRKLAALAEAGPAPSPTPMLTTPEAVQAYMEMKRRELMPVIEAEEVIDSGE